MVTLQVLNTNGVWKVGAELSRYRNLCNITGGQEIIDRKGRLEERGL